MIKTLPLNDIDGDLKDMLKTGQKKARRITVLPAESLLAQMGVDPEVEPTGELEVTELKASVRYEAQRMWDGWGVFLYVEPKKAAA